MASSQLNQTLHQAIHESKKGSKGRGNRLKQTNKQTKPYCLSNFSSASSI